MSFDDADARALAHDILTEFIEAGAQGRQRKVRRRWWWKPDSGKSGRYAQLEQHSIVHPTPRYWCAVCNKRGGSKQSFQKRVDGRVQLLLPFFELLDAAE